MKNPKLRRVLFLTLLSAIAYFVADWSVQFTAFLHFGSYIGIKNFLPVTLGMFFGPFGVSGCVLGCVATADVLHTPAREVAFECVCIAVMGMGMWFLWHRMDTSHRIRFKQGKMYLWYAVSLLGLSAVCGFLSLLFAVHAFWQTVAAYTSLGILVGLPVSILLGSLLCPEPVLPPKYRLDHDVIGCIADEAGQECLNEALEECALSRGVSRKRVFEVQNCIEEVSLRVHKVVPNAKIRICVDYSDAISVRFTYAGAKYNPLRMGKDEDEIDVMSLKLIEHRALRAFYRYAGGENHLHIVV